MVKLYYVILILDSEGRKVYQILKGQDYCNSKIDSFIYIYHD